MDETKIENQAVILHNNQQSASQLRHWNFTLSPSLRLPAPQTCSVIMNCTYIPFVSWREMFVDYRLTEAQQVRRQREERFK